jgi:hypothetical protein
VPVDAKILKRKKNYNLIFWTQVPAAAAAAALDQMQRR